MVSIVSKTSLCISYLANVLASCLFVFIYTYFLHYFYFNGVTSRRKEVADFDGIHSP